MSKYDFIISEATFAAIAVYKQELMKGKIKAGGELANLIQQKSPIQLSQADYLNSISTEEFLNLIVNTKKPQIYAETAIHGKGIDWNDDELAILGDINMAIPVTIFDDGNHTAPTVHTKPFDGHLLFTPGALLAKPHGYSLPDRTEVINANGEFDDAKYYNLYENRLLPLFLHGNEIAKQNSKKAFITIPGIGCGQFAGEKRGELGEKLQIVLEKILENHGDKLGNIKAIYFDPYNECKNSQKTIKKIDFLVKPLTKTDSSKSQLCRPEEYGNKYKNCEFFSVVAWDHVSWPGNDFWGGHRNTDDGVKAAATDVTYRLTEVKGSGYKNNQYNPPAGYANWQAVIEDKNKNITLKADKNNIKQYNLTTAPKKIVLPAKQTAPAQQTGLGLKIAFGLLVFLGSICAAGGAFLTATGFGAIIGIPLAAIGVGAIVGGATGLFRSSNKNSQILAKESSLEKGSQIPSGSPQKIYNNLPPVEHKQQNTYSNQLSTGAHFAPPFPAASKDIFSISASKGENNTTNLHFLMGGIDLAEELSKLLSVMLVPHGCEVNFSADSTLPTINITRKDSQGNNISLDASVIDILVTSLNSLPKAQNKTDFLSLKQALYEANSLEFDSKSSLQNRYF